MEMAKRAPEWVDLHLLTYGPHPRDESESSPTVNKPTSFKDNVHVHGLNEPGIPIHRDAAFKAFVGARINELIEEYDIDLVNSCSAMPDLLVIPGRISVPIVTTVHSTVEDHYRALKNLPLRYGNLESHERTVLLLGPLLVAAENLYYRGDRSYISVSDWGRTNLVDLKNVPQSRIEVIHNGVDGKIFSPSSSDKGREFFPTVADNDSPKILVLSRLTSSKATPYLSDAIGRISKKHDAQFVIAGSQSDRLVSRLGKGCTYLGYVPHELTPHLYPLCDIFLLPSLYENLPLSLLEAMASECGVVAGKVGGIPEAITNGIEGLLMSPSDPETIVEALDFMLDNPKEAREMGKRARARTLNGFSWDSAAERTYGYFKRIAENWKRSPTLLQS